MANFLPFEEFEEKWCFIGKRARISVTNEDLKFILPLTKTFCAQKWKDLIHISADHIMSSKIMNSDELKVLIPDCGCGDDFKEQKTRKFLMKYMKLKNDERLTFFWNNEHALETKWDVFLKYWPDFCFYGTPGGIIVFHSDPRVLIYSDEPQTDIIWIADRKRLFHLN